MGAQEILDLHGINIFAAGNNDILFAVHQINESVFIHSRHISCVKPAVFENFSGGFRISVITFHHTRAFDAKFTHFTLLHRCAFFINDLHVPFITGYADGADLMDIFSAEMDTPRPDGFRKAVIGVVFMYGKIFFPAFNQAGRNRLCADVHQPPLIELVIFQLDVTAFDGVQNILRPRNQQPHDGNLFFGNRLENPFRLHTAQQNGAASGQEAAEPVHFCARMIKRRDAEKIVCARLAMMIHFHFARHHQGAVRMKNGLWETGRA
ncbi:MAG: hypothetical protein BWX55_00930 [Deltaproteobacteria bacterium ADurb.Bin022]|nr:MAG: hypothetical protein BWX55_00930 [Deltaproteobacteria bacterium ADurb.Bin022]